MDPNSQQNTKKKPQDNTKAANVVRGQLDAIYQEQHRVVTADGQNLMVACRLKTKLYALSRSEPSNNTIASGKTTTKILRALLRRALGSGCQRREAKVHAESVSSPGTTSASRCRVRRSD